MFSNFETYRFPITVCGVPFMKGRYNPSTDDEKDDDTRETDETIGSLDTPVREHDSHSLDDERGTSSPTSMMVTARSIMIADSPKRVRFAIDDETTNRKRSMRNLRKNIIKKSAEQRQNDIPSSSRNRSLPSSPGRSSSVELSPPKSHSRRHGRRLRNHLASFVGSTKY